jgi:hypothetical protein
MQEMSDIQLEADDVTEILNAYCRLEALGRDGMSLNVFLGLLSRKTCENDWFVWKNLFFCPH